MEKIKRLFGAFILGGLAGVAAQCFLLLYGYCGMNALIAVVLTLISLGLLGMLAYVAGIYPKMEEVGGLGAMLPFSGLPPAIAMAIAMEKSKGIGTGQAVRRGIWPFFFIIASGTAASILIAVLTFILQGVRS